LGETRFSVEGLEETALVLDQVEVLFTVQAVEGMGRTAQAAYLALSHKVEVLGRPEI
jgi:hypothetical protein